MPILEIEGKKVEFDSMPSPEEIDEVASSFKTKPMFSTEAEGRSAIKKAEEFRKQAAFEASSVGFPVTQGLAAVNRAINTATGNVPEIIANLAGQTTRPITESDIARGTGEAVGFIAPTGAPMKVIKAAEAIQNPLTRNIVQGAGAMATQLPTSDRSTEEYVTGIATGGGLGAIGRGVEKVAEGAIQQSAKNLSGRIHDYLVKMPIGSFKFSKNPIKVMADEQIVANNMGEYAEIASKRLAERSQQLENAIQNSDKTVDVSQMVNKHLDSAYNKLSGSLKDRTSKIEELNTVRANLEAQYGDLSKLRVQDAIKLKRQLADDFPFTQEGIGDITTKVAHKIYHDINKFVESVHPEIAELNQRVSGLIDISRAAKNRLAVESRNNPIGLVGRLAGIGAAGVGIGAGVPVEGLIAGLGIMGVEKVIQSPAVLTRVAKALSALSGPDRIKVMEAYPKLKTVIKVDPRDVEIISQKREVGIPIQRKYGTIIDVEGKVINPKIEGNKQIKSIPYTPEYIQERSRDIPRSRRLVDESSGQQINIEPRLKVDVQGEEVVEAPIKATEQGESIIPIKKTPIISKKEKSISKGKIKGKTLIPKKLSSLAIGGSLVGAASSSEAGQEVDMDRIYKIESSNSPNAHNKTSNARGLGQITPIVLKEWNNFHPEDKHSDKDLFKSEINKKIASWYMNKRIPSMLKSKKIKDTIENRLIAYNAGIGKIGKILPKETVNYIKKYKQEN